jgi:hypothetical protein
MVTALAGGSKTQQRRRTSASTLPSSQFADRGAG